MARTNEHGQPIGEPLPAGWMPPPAPSAVTLEGAFVRVEPLDPPAHAADLFEAGRVDTTGASWTYLPDGPFESLHSLAAWLSKSAWGRDRLAFAFVDKASGRALGFGSYLRIQPTAGKHRNRLHLALTPPAAHADVDRSDAPADGPRLRARIPPLRVEVRCPERAFTGGRRNDWASRSRGSSAKRFTTRAATATPRGIR